ncbi:hypothetical protein Tco_0663934 [Tanacetum coccineum]
MLSKGVHEQTNHEKLKTVINTSDDDQIDFDIIFDDLYVENNGGTDEHDSNAHDQPFDIQSLIYTGLGYQNLERLKKAIVAQPKMYDGERLQSTKLIIDSPDYKETLEDAKESQLKMKDKMIQLEYEKLNSLYDTFVPQKEIPIEQTYFSTPSTFNVSSELSIEMSNLPSKKMPNENRSRSVLYDDQDTLRDFYKNGVIPMSISLRKCSTEIKQKVTEEVQEMLDIFESMEKKVEKKSQKDKKFQTKIDRLLEASLTREIKDCVLISVERQKNEILMLEKEKISSDS